MLAVVEEQEESARDAALLADLAPTPMTMPQHSTRSETLDESLVGIGGFVVNEGLGFLGRRRQAGEVERHAADQRVTIGFR